MQFKESIPWLKFCNQYRDIGAYGLIIFFCFVTYSNSSPRGLDVPVRRACFPSTLSMVEYLDTDLLLAKAVPRPCFFPIRWVLVILHPHAKGEAVVYP